MTTHDDRPSAQTEARVEDGLRSEAQTVRDTAPENLQDSILAALEVEPPRRANWRPVALLAAAASVALISMVALRLQPEETTSAPTQAGTDVALASRTNSIPRLSVATLSQPIARVEQPLRAELASLAADSEGLARTMLGGVPGPMRRLFGLPF